MRGRGKLFLDGHLLDRLAFEAPTAEGLTPSFADYAHLGDREHRLRIVVTRGRGGLDWFSFVGRIRRS